MVLVICGTFGRLVGRLVVSLGGFTSSQPLTSGMESVLVAFLEWKMSHKHNWHFHFNQDLFRTMKIFRYCGFTRLIYRRASNAVLRDETFGGWITLVHGQIDDILLDNYFLIINKLHTIYTIVCGINDIIAQLFI